LHEAGKAFAAAMEMGADRVEGKVQDGGDALVAELLLMVEDEDGAFDLGKSEQGRFDGSLRFVIAQDLLGGAGVSSGEGAGGLVF